MPVFFEFYDFKSVHVTGDIPGIGGTQPRFSQTPINRYCSGSGSNCIPSQRVKRSRGPVLGRVGFYTPGFARALEMPALIVDESVDSRPLDALSFTPREP